MIEIPNENLDAINKLNQKTGIKVETLKREYEKIFEKTNPHEFTSDDERHNYTIQVLWLRYSYGLPVKEYEVIPIGFSSVRMTKKGDKQASAFALTKRGNQVKLSRIVFQGDFVDLLNQITPFAKYKTFFGQYSSGDLVVDRRTSFEEPIDTGLDYDKILKLLKLEVIPVSETPNYVSRVGSDGYVDNTDWKAVRGLLARKNYGLKENNIGWYVFTLTDKKTLKMEPVVTSDGRVITPGLTVWTNDMFYNQYEKEAEIIACGTIQRKSNTPENLGLESVFMNGYLIIPVHNPPEGD